MKTGKGLADYAIEQVGKPYWWGTFGQLSTTGLLAQKRQQYPNYYTAGDFNAQLGQKVHDCVGLIKGYLWCDSPNDTTPRYNGTQDVSVKGLFDHCSNCGSLDTIPDVPGTCVFEASMGHVGVYIGGGKVVEAMGHAHGVRRTDLHGRKWAYWGQPDWINYEDNGMPDPDPDKPSKPRPTYWYRKELPLIKPGMVCAEAKTVQELLIAGGYDVGPDGADGEYGDNSVKTVKDFQKKHGLLVDGEVGGDTWSVLLRLRR